MSIMDQVVLISQAIMVILSMMFMMLASTGNHGRKTINTVYIAFACVVMNLGYYMEIKSTSLEAAVQASLIKNCGAFFVATLFLVFAYSYVGKKLNTKVCAVLSLWNCIALFCAWCWPYTDLYFAPIESQQTNGYYALEANYGIVAYINWAAIAFQMFACARIALIGYHELEHKKKKKSCLFMVACSMTPFFSVFFSIFNVLGGFRSMYALVTLGIMIFFVSAAVQVMFDISHIAHENIIANIDEPIIIVDANYGFVEANQHAQMVFPDIVDCVQGTPLPNQYLLSYIRTGREDKMFIGGRVYDVHVDRIYDEGQHLGYSLLLTDTTEDYNLINRMKELRQQAEEANEAKSDFFASMSHELRTPINTMIGMNEMIIRDAQSAKVKKYATDAKAAANMLLGLVNDILDNSKLNSGKLEIVESPYSFANMLVEVYNMMQVLIAEKSLEFTFDIDPGLPQELIGDDVRIRQILINLMTNAMKYTDKGYIRMHVTAEPAGQGKINVYVKVEDSGVGISNDRMDNIFSKFSRVESSRNHHVDGTGLGLNVCLNILRLMGSEMNVESELGVGSIFSFCLEQGLTENTARIGDFNERLRNNAYAEAEERDFYAPDASVLVVDDNTMNLRVFCGLLDDSKMTVTAVTSGMECLNLVRTHHYDIIFMDHMMPDMDGIETYHRMSELSENKCADTPVIMLTANVLQGSKESYVAEGFRDFLPKPVHVDQLKDMLRMYLPSELVQCTSQAATKSQ